jgi:hypothetical protein
MPRSENIPVYLLINTGKPPDICQQTLKTDGQESNFREEFDCLVAVLFI